MKNVIKEKWKPINGFEDCYSISSLGRIRRNKPNPYTTVNKILAPSLTSRGYCHTTLCDYPKRKTISIHCIVAEHFISKRPNGLIINHKNGIKTDNNVNNLEYVTCSENIQHYHKFLNKKSMKGIKKPHRVNIKQKNIIKNKYNNGITQKQLALEYDVSIVTIWRIIHSRIKKWK